MDQFLNFAQQLLFRIHPYWWYALGAIALALLSALPFKNKRWNAVRALMALVLVGAALIGEQAVLRHQFPWGFGVQIAAGILLALFIWPSAERDMEEPGQRPPLTRTEVLLLLGVILTSIFFRTYQLGEIGARFQDRKSVV